MQKKSLLNCSTMVEQLINISVPFLTYCATLPFSSRFFDFFLALALITVSLALSLKLSFWTKFFREFRRSWMKRDMTKHRADPIPEMKLNRGVGSK